jgi:hypothetical protein
MAGAGLNPKPKTLNPKLNGRRRQKQLADEDAGQGSATGGGGEGGGEGEGGRGKRGWEVEGERGEDAGQGRATGGEGKEGGRGEGGRGADSMMTNFVDIVVLNADTAVGRPLQVTQKRRRIYSYSMIL